MARIITKLLKIATVAFLSFSTSQAWSATPHLIPEEATASTTGSGERERINVAQPKMEQLDQQFSDLKQSFEAIKDGQDWLSTLTQIIAYSVVGISIFALVIQIISFRAQSRLETNQAARENALHSRFLELLDLSQSGTREAGVTLNLINSLLGITVETAQKASETERGLILSDIERVEVDCIELIGETVNKEERVIIAEPDFRQEVGKICRRIDALANEINAHNRLAKRKRTIQSPDAASNAAEIRLPAPCFFVRGQQRNIEQQFKEAIDDWNSALNAHLSKEIASDANYWIGYTHNTLGNFHAAIPQLEAALNLNVRRKAPELTRLLFETRFFALEFSQVPDDLLDKASSFYETISTYKMEMNADAYQRAAASFATTLGNVNLIKYVRSSIDNQADISCLNRAITCFDDAINHAQGHARWAFFGKCQATILLSAADGQVRQMPADTLRYVIGSVRKEYSVRGDTQPRSQLLCKATEYMCVCMLGDATDDEKKYMLKASGEVERLSSNLGDRYIYSQFRKQNVNRETFIKEFEYFETSGGDMAKTMKSANVKGATETRSPEPQRAPPQA